MEQQIGFATRPDGARLAYAVTGEGPPLVMFGTWGHLQLTWENPRCRAFYEALAQHHTLIRFDSVGTGLSDREPSDFSVTSDVTDLVTVIDHLGLDRLALLGWSAPAPITYAAAHPNRLTHLILFGAYAHGEGVGTKEVRDSAIALLRSNYRLGQKVFIDVIASGDPECERFADAAYRTLDAETVARLFEAVYETDVREALPNVLTPTLVLHREGDRATPIACGREVAAGIGGARFVPLEGRVSRLEFGDTAPMLQAIHEFIGDAAEPSEPPALWRDRYESLGVAGEGGQGSVLRAQDHQHERIVALKVRAAGAGVDRSALLSEARILLNLTPHPGLPLVRDDFFVDEQYIVVMDWVEGTDLRTLLDRQGDPGLPVGSVLGYLTEVAQALDHLHSHEPPIVHGDVKPANIILNAKGRAVLVDFGIATVGEDRVGGSGTRGFVAPEVAAGAKPTPASDIFSLAATTYALLTGRSLEGEWEDPEGIAGGELRALGRAIRRGLSVDPSRRPRTAGEFLERLRSSRSADLPTGTVTFLLTDVEGSTPLWEQHPGEMPRVLARHEHIVADAVEAHNGRFIKSRGEGDSTLSVFVRASDAMSAAITMQRALHAERWPDGIELRVRAALHTGDAELREGDYYGPTVNRAARIRGAGAGGEVVMSQTTSQLVSDVVPSDAQLVDYGVHELRGLARHEQIYRLDVADLHPAVPATTVSPPEPLEPERAPGPVDLPVPRTTFIGREREITDVLGLLSKSRLVTLTGAGGSGKTRLAIEVATRDAARHHDGAFFVDLTPVSNDGTLSAFANAVSARGDPSDLQAMVLDYLSDRDALIVLDNCEHVLDASADLVDLVLSRCPGVRILATSREPLQLDGEQTFRVPTLPTGDEQSEAVQLFASRARAVAPSFAIDHGNRDEVLTICRHLDGIPLAIELAAAQVDHLSVADIARGLDDRFKLLVGGGRRRAERQQTLRAAMDWSWELLSEGEREALRRLSVFAGPFTHDSAEGIASASTEVIRALVSKSLVVMDEETSPTRYRLLETVRFYGRERLEEAGETDRIRDAHRDWYLAWTESLGLDGLCQARIISRLNEVYADLRLAIDRSDAQGEVELSARQLIVAFPLSNVAARREEMKQALARIGDDERFPATIRAEALAALAWVLYISGDLGPCRLAGSRSIDLDPNDRPFLPMALMYALGDREEAREAALRLRQPAFARMCRAFAIQRTILSDPAGAASKLEELTAELDPDVCAYDHTETSRGLVAARLILGDASGAYEALKGLRAAWRGYDETTVSPSVAQQPELVESIVLACLGRCDEARSLLLPVTRVMLHDRYPGVQNRCLIALAFITFREGDPLRAAELLEPFLADCREAPYFFSLALWLLDDLRAALERLGIESPLPDQGAVMARRRTISEGTFVIDRDAERRIEEKLREFVASESTRDEVTQTSVEVAPPRAPDTSNIDLPVPRTSFIGREREVRDVLALLSASRLVTLTGVGGTGKTRLALEVAKRDANRHPDGAFFVDLAPVATPDGVVRAVASAVNAQGDPSDLAAMVVGFLSGRAALIVLDNCEHVIDASAELVDRLLAACPTVTVLATSREPLQLDGEQIFRVPTLDADDEASDAVLLFVARARTVQPEFVITDANRTDVLAVCRHLDGIPLALELAAGRVNYVGLSDIAARLSERFSLLVGGGRGGAQRQQTLQAAIDWSWDLLNDREKETLRRLAVFAGPFTLEAAEGICGARADAIASLVAKSLVTVARGAEPVRYRLLETMRVYANDRLAETGEEESLRDAHRDWYLAWSESFADEDFFEARRANRFIREHDNIRAGMDRSASQNRADLFARQMIAVGLVWNYQPALQKETKLGLLEIASNERLAQATRADAHALLAIASMNIAGDIAAIRTHSTKSIELDTSDRRYYPLALWLSGHVQDAEAVARRLGQPWFARLCRTAGAGTTILSDSARALRTFDAVAAELDPDTSGWDRIFTYISLVATKLILGDETARDDARSLRAAFAVFDDESFGGFHSYADVLEAMTLAQIGRLADARELHRSASELALRDGWPGIERECLLALAYITYCESDPLRAAMLLEPLTQNALVRMWPMWSVLFWLTNELNTTLAASHIESPLPDIATMGATLRGLTAGTKTLEGDNAWIVETVRRGIAEETPAPAVLAQAPVRPSTLPAERTSFIGRERELSEIAALLARARLVTLAGVGGTGKTRLAIEAAAAASADFPDGVYFCDLAPLRDANHVVRTVGQALSVLDPLAEAGHADDASAAEAVERHLINVLESRRLLIVLDNCEHVLDAAARLCDGVLDNCPNVRIMATSREPIGVQGEKVFRVPPLGVASEAVQLLCERARAVRPDFDFAAHETAVGEICRRLDGLPLALELAAARLNVLSPSQLAERLDDAFRVLTSGGRTVERHRTLQAAMDWSYDQLAPEEQIVLRRCSVFVGGWSLEAAEDVCGREPLAPRDVLDLLARLVDKSFVLGEEHEGVVRYRVLEPVRQFAAEKLSASDEEADVHRAHRDHFDAYSAGIRIAGQVDYSRLPQTLLELDNIRAAFDWSVAAGNAAPALRIASNAYPVLRHLGRVPELGRWFRAALAIADDRPSHLVAGVLDDLAIIAADEGDVPASVAYDQRSIEIRRALGFDSQGSGRVVWMTGDYDEMLRRQHWYLELLELGDDPYMLAQARWATSICALFAGRYDESMRHARDCLAMNLPDAPGHSAMARVFLGVNLAITGDAEAGRTEYEAGLEQAAGGSRSMLHWALFVVGAYEACAHNRTQRLREDIELARALAMSTWVALDIELAAHVLARRGATREAARLFGAAESHLDRFGVRTRFEEFRGEVDASCRLAQARFPDEYEQGASLSLPGAADLALEVLVDDDRETGQRLRPPAGLVGRDEFPFVGRLAERVALDAAWNEGDPTQRLVLIAGEPGAGKTRLAREFATAAHNGGATVLFGRCDDGLAVPFQPFVEALKYYVNSSAEPSLGPLAAELTRLVPELDGEPLKADPETEQYRLFEAVREWLEAASADQPIVLVLDDLHWATRPTLLMLRHVVRSAAPGRVLILGTYRDTEPGDLAHLLPDLRAELITLAGLHLADVAQLVSDESTATSIHAATDGNPFFIGEVMRHHAESGTSTIPEGARQVVAQRLSRLTEPTREVLTLAAVAGEEFELAVIAHSRDDVETALDEAIAAHLVREVPGPRLRYRFAHALVRSAIEDGLTAARQARLHEKVAEGIEAVHASAIDDYTAPLARHWLEAAPLGHAAKAVEYARRAAELARVSLSLEDAATWYRRALELLGPDDEALSIDLLTSLGDTLHWAGDIEHRTVLIEASNRARQIGDPVRLGAAALALAPLGGYVASGVPGGDFEFIALGEEALAGLAGEESVLRAELLAALARELRGSDVPGQLDRIRSMGREAVLLARKIDDVKAIGRILYSRHLRLQRAQTAHEPDNLDERTELATTLISIGTERGDIETIFRGHLARVRDLMETGELNTIRGLLPELEGLAGELRHPLYTWLCAIARAALALLCGPFDEAERWTREAIRLGAAAGHEATAVNVGAIQAANRSFQQGRAAQWLESARDQGRPDYLWALMEAYAGEADKCRRWLDTIDARPRDWMWLGVTVAMGLAVAEIGHTSRAPRLYEELLPHAGRSSWGPAVSHGPVSFALGRLATTLRRWDDAETHFRTCAEWGEREGARPWLAMTRCEWARMLRGRGRTEDLVRIRDLARQALASAEELGMAQMAARARELLRVPLPSGLRSHDELPFVGRANERATIDVAWNEGDPASHLVLIAGEPGAGKTRLAGEFASSAFEGGATVLFGRCDDGLAVPFQPFVEALKHYTNGSAEPSFGSLAPELLRLVPELRDRIEGEPLKADPETEQYRLFEAVAEWLAAASQETPIVLVLDDLHWATRPTLLMLRRVVRADVARVLIVATYRDTEPGALADVLADLMREATKRVALGGLEPDDVAALVEDELSGPAVHAATGGNPFFVGELVRHRAESGDDSTPEVAQEIVAKRLSRLSETTREVLTMAAVCGEEFELGILGRAIDGAQPALDEAVAARLVHEIPGPALRHRFDHALVRSAIEEGLTAARRAVLHEQVGEAIESVHASAIDDHLPALARHWLAAAPLGHATKAVDYARRAGDLARASLSLEDAAAWYRRALELLGPDDEALRIDLLTALGDALHWAGDADHRDVLIDAATRARTLGDPVRLGRAALALAPPGSFAGSPGAADTALVAFAEDALAQLPDETALRAELLAALAMYANPDAQPARRELAREALDIASRVGGVKSLGRIAYTNFFRSAHPDNVEERLREAIDLTSIGIERGDIETTFCGHFLRHEALMELGDLSAAKVVLDEAYRLALELRHPVYTFAVLSRRARYPSFCGPVADAGQHVEECVRLARDAGYEAWASATAVAFDAHLAWQQGRSAEAIEVLEVIASATRISAFEMALALLQADAGDLDGARRTLDEAGPMPRDFLWLGAMVMKASAVALTADASRALEVYDELLPYAGRIPWMDVLSKGPVSLGLGLLARTLRRWDEAETHLRSSVELCERMGALPWLARTRCEWASMLRDRGRPEDREAARELATQALEAAEALGMAAVAAQARELLRIPLPVSMHRPDDIPFVGRQVERARLESLWNEVRSEGG